jgi:hypothetical protein
VLEVTAKRPFSLSIFVLLAAGFGTAEASPPNWTGIYAPCNRHSDLLSREHLDLGVRISTSNMALARQFARAMDFWTGVLDLDWHEVDSQNCALQVVDGTPEIFDSASRCECLTARSQFPDRPGFQGWIAFNPGFKFTKEEMFLDSVHEIGHLFGLPHNPSDLSVMYFDELDKSATLDSADLDALAARHRLRAGIFGNGGQTDARVMVSSRQTAGRSRGWFRLNFIR